ncbi:hypothetical protein NN561_005434 [Cricetulus griseus]
MRDFGFGVLHTALLRSGSPRSSPGGGSYRPFAAGPSATPFGPLSPPPLPVTGFSEAASPFAIPSGGGAATSAAASSSSPLVAHQQAVQDELLLGLTQQPARPLSGAAAAEQLPSHHPGGGTNAAPPKFTRSTPSLTPKSWIEDNVFRTDNNSNTLLPLQVRSSLQLPAWGSDSLQDSWCTAAGTSRIDQDRSRMYDSLNMHSLENSLIDIMRAEHDPLKARSYGRRRGRSSLFPIDDSLLDDGHSDQVGVLNSPTCYSAHQNGERIERFSRKVFVGGLPPDIDEDEITASFRRFGPLVVDWPHKAESKSYFPPKVELAMIMDRLYGGVCYAGIDTDPELKYPKGAGRVAFSNQQSYIAAISARFVQLQHGDIDKRVEVKPYVLDDQMCDECQGARCGGKFAPFFCANVTCLQYYCEFCWANIHSRAGREFHKPLVKEGADRPRQIHFRWN